MQKTIQLVGLWDALEKRGMFETIDQTVGRHSFPTIPELGSGPVSDEVLVDYIMKHPESVETLEGYKALEPYYDTSPEANARRVARGREADREQARLWKEEEAAMPHYKQVLREVQDDPNADIYMYRLQHALMEHWPELGLPQMPQVTYEPSERERKEWENASTDQRALMAALNPVWIMATNEKGINAPYNADYLDNMGPHSTSSLNYIYMGGPPKGGSPETDESDEVLMPSFYDPSRAWHIFAHEVGHLMDDAWHKKYNPDEVYSAWRLRPHSEYLQESYASNEGGNFATRFSRRPKGGDPDFILRGRRSPGGISGDKAMRGTYAGVGSYAPTLENAGKIEGRAAPFASWDFQSLVDGIWKKRWVDDYWSGKGNGKASPSDKEVQEVKEVEDRLRRRQQDIRDRVNYKMDQFNSGIRPA